MTVKLARLENIPEIDESKLGANRRREPRFAAWFDATIENSRGDCAKIQIAEVSLHGCRISTREAWLRVGGFVAISLDRGTKMQAIVRWVRDGAAGMEFLRPIPPQCSDWHDLMDAEF